MIIATYREHGHRGAVRAQRHDREHQLGKEPLP
jgi:hypothetical protein